LFFLPGLPQSQGHTFAITIGQSDGMTAWSFPSLQQVVNGKVLLYDVSVLSTPDAVDWSDILPNGRADGLDYQVGTDPSVQSKSILSPYLSCAGNFCWSNDQCHICTSFFCHASTFSQPMNRLRLALCLAFPIRVF